MVPPIAHRKQHFFNEMQARFIYPKRLTFTDTIERRRCFCLWVILARILNQPQVAPIVGSLTALVKAAGTPVRAV